jgi:Fur family ferric uptake transcriptional regulator
MAFENVAVSPLEELKTTIRKVGLRSTAPRVAVLRKLEQARSPISHAELVEWLAGEGLDRTTIYRNLVDLTDAGLVERSDLGDHIWRFELRRENGTTVKHSHFTCTECGAVACLPEVTVSAIRGASVPRSLVMQQVEVQLRGLCDECS